MVRLVGVSLLEVGIRPLLVFDALLDVLVVQVELFDAVVGAVKVPVTLKTRLGWDDTLHNARARWVLGASMRRPWETS